MVIIFVVDIFIDKIAYVITFTCIFACQRMENREKPPAAMLTHQLSIVPLTYTMAEIIRP